MLLVAASRLTLGAWQASFVCEWQIFGGGITPNVAPSSPRQGEPGDEVRLRGSPTVVNKLKAELEKVVKDLRDRVVMGVNIPAVQHKALIGRGGQHLNDLQARTGAQVQFPGSRSYNQVGAPENADELKDTSPADVVKVSGPRAACEKAITELKVCVPCSIRYHTILTSYLGFGEARSP